MACCRYSQLLGVLSRPCSPCTACRKHGDPILQRGVPSAALGGLAQKDSRALATGDSGI